MARCLASVALLFGCTSGLRVPSSRDSCPFDQSNLTSSIRPICSLASPRWKDADGNDLEAHGAGILEHTDGKIYWYGESKKPPWNPATPPAINLYISEGGWDGPWKFAGQVLNRSYLQRELDKDAAENGHFQYDVAVIERPKVLYNEATQLFVMWLHVDGSRYLQRQVSILTSPRPEGPFVFRKRLAENKGMSNPALDMSLWKDPVTKKGFFIRDMRKWWKTNEHGFGVDFHYRTGLSLMSDDYLSIERDLPFPDTLFEGMAIFYETPTWPKYEEHPAPGGRYWMVGSELHGWFPSDLIVWQTQWGSQGLDDPQNVYTQVAGAGSWKSSICVPSHTGDGLRSQPAYITRTRDRNGDQYFVYHGDNWVLGLTDDSDQSGLEHRLQNAGYVWLPFKVNSGELKLHWRSSWSAKTILAKDL